MDTDLKQILAHNDRQFDDIAKSMKEMKDLLNKIDQRQQDHYVDFVSLQKDVEYANKEIAEVKAECMRHVQEEQDIRSGKLKNIWNELRQNKADDDANYEKLSREIKEETSSRDKKLYAALVLIVPSLIAIAQLASEFITK